ncbi:Jacalin-like lectin domain [Phytophthora cactorum]|nr:Jacalin-like lectin domain [Phytophthora cactorum]
MASMITRAWVVTILQAFVCLFLVVLPGAFAADDSVQLSDSFGGPHGTEFSDQASVAAGQTIGSITIRAGERVDGISLEVAGPTAATFSHGGTGGTANTLALAKEEYITSMEAHWGEKKGRTRIFYLSFGTSAGNTVSGGSQTESKNTVTAPKGFQLGGFFGLDGDEIDKLGAIWTPPIKKKKAAAAPTKKKKAAAVASSEGSDVGSTEDSAVASNDDSGSAEAPIKKKKKAAAAAPTKKKKAATVASSEGSDVGSTEASALASDDASSSAEAPIKKKKAAAAPLRRRRQQHSSSPTKKKKAAAVASSEGSDVGSTEDSAVASGNTSGSAEAPIKTKKKAAAAAPTKKKKAAAVASSEGSDVASADASGSAEAPIKTKKKAAAAASSEDSALASADASGSAEVPSSAVESTAGSAVASAPGSAAASTAQQAAESAEGSAAAPPAGSGPAEAPAAPAMSVKDSIVLSESFGGPHGDDFSDKNFVNSGQKVTQISIYAGERLDGISMEISSPKTLTFTHGGTGGDRKVLKLGEGEYVNSMEVHWGKKNDRTRIFYVNFLTSAGNSLSGGSMTDDKSTVTAPEGFQLAGFFGKSGKEIDTLGAVWAYIDLVTPAPTPVPAPTTIEDSPGTVAPEDIAGSLSEVKTKANKRPVQLSDSFGGPHGEQFSDQLACTSGMTISSVTIRAGERLDGLTVQVSAPKEMTFTHGGTGGTENTLTLEPGEYITTMEVHWGQKSGHTRIFYMNLGTSKGNSVSGGSETKEKGSVTAPRGYQLAGFFGRYGDEMDLIGAVWSSIAAVNETSSTVKVSSEDDIALSELFGGPHGNAFSDINDIKFGQTISSITLRSAKRVDAVTLKITAPIETVLNHGGRGGTEQTITLAADEYITSMEAHWDKKDKHTRVFYISFTTSAGQTIAGGTKTENSGTATAPDGFVLSGFYGRGGDEVDQIGAIWTRKTAKNVDLTDPSGLGNGTYGTTIRNWVGPTIGKSSDTACYRKSMDFDSNNICPLGYSKDGDDCAARCPLSYPIACGLECIPQNDDCVLAVLAKIGSVVAVALNAATGGVFGQILTAYKVAKWAVLCVRNLVEVIRGLVYYLRYRQTSAPVGATAEMLTIAYQADVVLYDLPIAICTCLNLPVPKNAQFADTVLVIVEGIVKQAITNVIDHSG